MIKLYELNSKLRQPFLLEGEKISGLKEPLALRIQSIGIDISIRLDSWPTSKIQKNNNNILKTEYVILKEMYKILHEYNDDYRIESKKHYEMVKFDANPIPEVIKEFQRVHIGIAEQSVRVMSLNPTTINKDIRSDETVIIDTVNENSDKVLTGVDIAKSKDKSVILQLKEDSFEEKEVCPLAAAREVTKRFK